MSIQVVALSSAPQQSFMALLQVDGRALSLNLAVKYNEMAGCWMLSIADVNNKLLVDSIPLITGEYPAANLLEQHQYLGIGSAYVIDASNSARSSTISQVGYGEGGFGLGGGYGGGGTKEGGIVYPDQTNLGSSFALWWADTPPTGVARPTYKPSARVTVAPPPPSGPLAPVIPGTAVSSGLLDNFAPQNWQSTHDAGTPGTSSGTSGYVSPAVGRNFTFTYTGHGGQRYSLYFALDTTSQNYCFDLEVAFDDPTQILNMELDMNQVLSDGRTVIFDCQCAHVSQTWEYNAWQPSTVYGDPQTWGISVYHHVRIFWHRDVSGNVTTWDGVEFDGVYHPFVAATANTAQSLGWAVGRLVCNFQIEGASSGSGSVSAYGRNMIVWRW